jgi:hypothetical protein
VLSKDRCFRLMLFMVAASSPSYQGSASSGIKSSTNRLLQLASCKFGASAFRSRCLPSASRDETVHSGAPVACEIARLVWPWK